jgi:hypothetical protein
MPISSTGPARQGGAISNNSRMPASWVCRKPFRLACVAPHPEGITAAGEATGSGMASEHREALVPCGRWRTCRGCCLRLQWQLRQRYLVFLTQPLIPPILPMFFTLTFSERQVTEDQAQRAWRSLVGRLRYRGYLGCFCWVLQRQRPPDETLHFHGLAELPYFPDDLAEWRELIRTSGFGVQNRLEVAKPEHAGYIAGYISTRLAHLARLRRAYGFSNDFPKGKATVRRCEIEETGSPIGLQAECEWVASYELVG